MRIWVCALALAACGKSANSDACRQKARALGELLITASADAIPPFQHEADVHPILRTDLAAGPIDYAPVVIIGTAGIRYQGEPIGSDALVDRLAADYAKAQGAADRQGPRKPPREPRRAYMVVDATTPSTEVVRVFDAVVASGLTAVGFVFEAPQPLKPPPRSSADPALDKIFASEAGDRASQLAKFASGEIAECKQLRDVFGEVASEELDNRALTISRQVAPALEACNCNVDIERLRSTMFRTIYIERPARVVQLDPAAPAEEIVVDPTSTWAELSKRLTATTKNVRFVVR
ncbi:MAG: hypothetical protein ABI591_18945 [Kofleriaceae bacterium]